MTTRPRLLTWLRNRLSTRSVSVCASVIGSSESTVQWNVTCSSPAHPAHGDVVRLAAQPVFKLQVPQERRGRASSSAAVACFCARGVARRLDVRDDLVDRRQRLAQRFLEGGRLCVRLLHGQRVADLQVQLEQVPAALQVVDADAVRAHALLRREHPHSGQHALVVRLDRVDLDDDVRARQDSAGPLARRRRRFRACFSSGVSRATVRRTSAKLSGPLTPHAHLPDLEHARHAHRALRPRPAAEPGTPSSSATTVRLPSCRLTYTTMPATIKRRNRVGLGQRGNAQSLGEPYTKTRPTMTTAEDQMSVEKCRASASSAWLSYFLAVR